MTSTGAQGVQAPAAPATLRVRLLGGFAVEGVDERAIGTRKARLLLKRLAVARGRPVPAAEVADAVWGDEPPGNPASQVSVLVSRLRAVLGSDRLPRGEAGYALAADWIDVVELEARASEVEERLRHGELGSALAAAHAALAIARGPLLPEEEGDWVEAARPAADRLLARARLLAAEAALAAGELEAARAAAQSVLDHDAYDEAALRVAMRADAAAGRPGAALAAYAAMRERLGEELGTDPAAETDALHSAILRGEITAVATTAQSGGALVGRQAELGLLDGLLARVAAGEPLAAVVDAEAGLGKSALLAAWTRRAAASALVLAGRCDELGRDLPLQPIADSLAGHLAGIGREAATALLGDDHAALAGLLSGTPSGDAAGVTVVGDADAGRIALFGALAAVVARAAGQRPLVLAVDDLHLAAPGTAEFLAFARRRLPRVLVLATRRPEPGPDLPGAVRLGLAALSVEDAAVLVGAERAASLHRRSGGHPLFLRELAAAAAEDELPASIVDAVRRRLGGLGEAARTVEAAAICGTEVDAELVAAVTARPLPAVLDDLEAAARAGLLVPHGAALAFRHELVRDAIEAGASPPRRSAVHRAAVACLATRPQLDAMAVARHARLGGDHEVAAAALAEAAAGAALRFESAAAEELLDHSLALHDSIAARLARARLRIARLDLDGAGDDAERAMDLGAGPQGFEVAGWVAYYARDYETALRYADEGVERAGDDAVRASCLALAGRIRHTRGDLAEAAPRLAESVAIAPAAIRGTVQVWHAQLLAHRGETGAATDLARRALLDRHPGHPFAALHGRFTLAYALAVAGRWAEAFTVVDEMEQAIARSGDRRFPPVAANVRGWLLRGAGQVEAAREVHAAAAEMPSAPTFLEPRYAAGLDLAEDWLAAGEVSRAADAITACAEVMSWTGSMHWKHRNRYRLLADRIASLGGDHAGAAADARSLAAAAAERGDARYRHRALLVAAAADARAGVSLDPAAVQAMVDHFLPVCGPDGWRDVAELAAATRSEHLRRCAEELAAGIVAAAAQRPDLDSDAVARAVRSQLDRAVGR